LRCMPQRKKGIRLSVDHRALSPSFGSLLVLLVKIPLLLSLLRQLELLDYFHRLSA